MFEYLNDQWVETVLTAAGHLRSGALRCVHCLFWLGLVTVVMSLHSVSPSLDDSSQDKQRKDSPDPKSSVTQALGEGHKISSIDFETRSVFDYGKVISMVLFSAWHITLAWRDKELQVFYDQYRETCRVGEDHWPFTLLFMSNSGLSW